ncbi:MAG TPA: hypothetical protein VFV96_16995 [Verrucomicrobiae bacterium]|nr:hypothetical protein [Verrucomicrobiae bacterium]
MRVLPTCRKVGTREEVFGHLAETRAGPTGGLAFFPLTQTTEKGIHAMIKTFQFMNEAIKSTKHPFRKTESQPRKAQKNRYERRKVKEFLHLSDWGQEEMA